MCSLNLSCFTHLTCSVIKRGTPPSFPLQVDCLVLQLHRIGEQLEKVNSQQMDELFFLLRDGFLLQEGLTSMARLLLLEILEFRAGGWMLSTTAHKYYYSEIAD